MYKIKLPVFEGPFDLLLFLIRKNEIDIYDIPIASIIRQYLDYLEMMKMLNLEVAGEFIEMAATLMLIKVRMLLPNPPTDGEEDIPDPRVELVNQLLEYKKFKEASNRLRVLEEERKKIFPRPAAHLRNEFRDQVVEEVSGEASLFDLLTALKLALDNIPTVTVHQVTTIKVSLEEQVEYILARLEHAQTIKFSELVSDMKEKMRLIVTFMALLDLIRLGLISARQSDHYGEIRLKKLKKGGLELYYQLRDPNPED